MRPGHIRTADDLVTSRVATRNGFREQALTKVRAAAPYIEGARRFWRLLQTVGTTEELTRHTGELQEELMAAAGFSDKASNYLTPEERRDAIRHVLECISITLNTAR
jgi:hypothetical protein